MASSHKGNLLEGMSVDQKTKLLYTLSETPHVFYRVLQDWNCHDIRQILCTESDNEKKYTGLTKDETINILLETILDKTIGYDKIQERSLPRKVTSQSKGKGALYCQNLGCQATLIGQRFCKSCSCFICHKFDVNKDASLWLRCNPLEGESCAFSYHLACALESEKSGLKEDNKPSNDLDASFYCVSCGKPNSSLESWKKQLIAAKEATKVSDLRKHLLYAQQLLKGTNKYRILSEATEKAANSLVAVLEKSPELRGPLTGVPLSKCRGSINRLGSMALEVKERCSSALEEFESLPPLPCNIQGSLISTEEEGALALLDLVSNIRNSNNHSTPLPSRDTKSNGKGKRVSFKADSTPLPSSEQRELVTQLEAVPETLSLNLVRSNQSNDHQNTPENGINMENPGNHSFGFEHCVMTIRKLELSGHIDSTFRTRFLTWLSLNATPQEMVVVKTFIEIFKDDLAALAEQLIDTFTEPISRKRSATEGGSNDAPGAGSAGCSMQRRH